MTRLRNPSTVWVAIAGFAFALIQAVRVLATAGGDPSIFIQAGEERQWAVDYARDRLGDVEVAPSVGHDGALFFIQANDPWHLAPEQNGNLLDRPTYRAQRMLYPALASGFGMLPPVGVAWGLVIVNVVAIGIGTLATAAVASSLAINRWWGFAFALNPGAIHDLRIDGGGAVALALAVVAIAAMYRQRPALAATALTGSVLSRETMLIAAVGLLIAHRVLVRVWRWSLVAIPFSAVLLWAGYLRLRLDDAQRVHDFGDLNFPFRGFAIAFSEWITIPGSHLAMGLLILVLGASLVHRCWRKPSYLGWACVGFVVLAVLMDEPVWRFSYDSSRAVAPIFIAWPLLVVPEILRRRKVAGKAEVTQKA